MQQHRFFLALSIVVTSVSVNFWGDSVFVDRTASRLDVGAACTTAVIAALLWVTLWAVVMREHSDRRRVARDADMSTLIRMLADDGGPRHLSRVLPSTVPLPRHRLYDRAL